jgi:hypothetical protein
MPNRTAKCVPAITASLFAGALIASLGAIPARAADECLATPKGEMPSGSHWYYRIEHPSNRHCWYLREEGDAAAKTVSSNSTAAANPPAPKPDATMPGSVANARAEFSPRASINRDSPPNTGQVPAAVNAASIDNTAPAPDPHLLGSVVASRWPDQLGANSTTTPPPPAAVPPVANPPADLQANAAPSPQPAATAVPLAAADAAMAKQSDSAVMLLAVIVGALSVAGLVASAVFRFGKPRRSRKDVDGEVRQIWDLDRELKPNDRPQPLPFPAAAVHRPNIGAPLELQEADDPDEGDRIAQMMERLARSAQA